MRVRRIRSIDAATRTSDVSTSSDRRRRVCVRASMAAAVQMLERQLPFKLQQGTIMSRMHTFRRPAVALAAWLPRTQRLRGRRAAAARTARRRAADAQALGARKPCSKGHGWAAKRVHA